MVATLPASGDILAWGAAGTGIGSAFIYMLITLLLKKISVDDVMENFAIYVPNTLWGMFCSVLFFPVDGILWGNPDSGA